MLSLTPMVPFLRFHLAETTSMLLLQGGSQQAQQELNLAKAPAEEAELNENSAQGK